jgi:NAD(P)H-hydrate epimerase
MPVLKVVSIAKMREIEANADAGGLSYDMMMQNAGRAVADRALNIISGLQDARVTVLVGAGNNGGDGLVAGKFIAQDSEAQLRFYLLKRREVDDNNFKAVHEAGLFIAYSDDDKDGRVIRNMVASADLIIDAIFGIGVRLPLKGDVVKVLRYINQALNEPPLTVPVTSSIMPSRPGQYRQAQKPYVLAVDCPTGLDCDTGQIDTNAIHADETVTFIAAKPGLLLFPGAEAVGQLSVAPINVPADLKAWDGENSVLVDSEMVRTLLPKRPVNSNKGTFGKVLVVAGSVNYMGAPALVAEAAYRIGAGLVTVAAPQPVVASLAAKLTEPTWLLLPQDMGVISEQAAKIVLDEATKYDVLLLGPGWGTEDTTRAFLNHLLNVSSQMGRSKSHQPIGFVAENPPATSPNNAVLPQLVLDADGLNLLSKIPNWWTLLPEGTVITPHPGEMGRLAKLDIAEIQTRRWEIAHQKAIEWRVVLLLKGAHTIIAAPDGRMAILPFKTDALAKAGTGDVLAGVIAGLLAQGMPPYEAALAGGYLHGLAGQNAGEWNTTRSVVAGDVLKALGSAIEMVEKV